MAKAGDLADVPGRLLSADTNRAPILAAMTGGEKMKRLLLI
jgi:hypothetical protein